MAEVADKYKDLADSLMRRDAHLKRAQEAYERMSRLQYKLPSPLDKFDWVRPVITAAPYNALRGAVRALANLDEGLSIHPITVQKALENPSVEGMEAKELANRWETILKWELGKAGQRRGDLRDEAIWSAATFDEVNAQLIHVPTEMKLTGIEGPRLDAALMYGEWMVRFASPLSMYVLYTDYGVEAVLSVKAQRAQDLIGYWGKAASKLERDVGNDREGLNEIYIEYDLVNHADGRVAWYGKGPSPDLDKDGELLTGPAPWLEVVENGKNTGEQVPFLPWINEAGGTSLDPEPAFQRKPILFPVYMTEQWATANITATIMASEAIATGVAPGMAVKGPGAPDVDIEFGDPSKRINLTPLQTVEILQKQGIDPAIREIFDRMAAEISDATVAEVLVTGRPISGEQAYASYQLQVLQAVAALGNVRELGNRFFETTYTRMLQIAHYTGNDIESYATQEGDTIYEGLKSFKIDSEDIDPDKIQISVELKTDVPLDRQQRVTSAMQIAGSGVPYSPTRLLEMLGETDPEGAIKEHKLFQLDMADWQGKLQLIQAQASGQIEQMAAQMAQGMVAQMAEQQEQGQQQDIPGPTEGVEGQGFNPAVGGQPPATAVPGTGGEAVDRGAVPGLGPIGRVPGG